MKRFLQSFKQTNISLNDDGMEMEEEQVKYMKILVRFLKSMYFLLEQLFLSRSTTQQKIVDREENIITVELDDLATVSSFTTHLIRACMLNKICTV